MKGHRVNDWKKVMRCQVDKGQIGDSGEYPCSVCKKRVGSNSGMCLKSITVGSIKDAAAFQVEVEE